MTRSNRVLLCGSFLLLSLMGGVAVAGDAQADGKASDLKKEIANLHKAVADLEASGENENHGDAASLTSIRRRGMIKIGGQVAVDVLVKNRDDVTSDSDEVNSTEFHTNMTNLRFRVEASPDVHLYIKLDLNGNLDGVTNQDDLLEEVRFVWQHIRGSNWGLVFGKGEVPYGQDRTLGIIQSYNHNDSVTTSEGPVFLLAGTEAGAAPGTGNPLANVGRVRHPGEVDRVFMASANYTYKDWLRWEVAVFQNNDSTGGIGRLTRGMHEDRSDDNLLLQSFSSRVWLTPVERLTLEASFIREYNDSMGDAALRTDLVQGGNATEAQYAVSVGFQYEFANAPLEIFGEYQHGWDWNYNDQYSTDTAQLGLLWNTTEALGLGVMAEWLGINDDDGPDSDEDYYKLVLHSRYRFSSGITLMLEYAHEWFNGNIAGGNNRDADVLAFRMGWSF